MDGLDSVVRNTILAILRETDPALERVEDHQGLTELGMQSLDVARMVAELDLSLEADPFSELVSMTSVRTVGDVIGAYRRYFDGEPEPVGDELADGRRRAAARSQALAEMEARRDPSKRPR